MEEKEKRCNEISNEIRSSYWANTISMKEYNYTLNKHQIWDI